MKIRSVTLVLTLLGLFVVIFSSFMPYPSGAPNPYYYTGSPSDGHDCSSCHGNSSNVTGWITTTIPGSGYVPGTTYQITATNSISGSGKYGFELSPQNATGTYLGTLQAGSGSKLVGSKWITQSNASNSVTSWTFNWVAPAAGTGNVTFYASFARSTGSSVKNCALTVTEAAGSLPGAAGPITGPATVCAGSNSNSYSVGSITGATSYVWSVPSGATIASGQGTTSISVNFSSSATSGNVSVYGTNTTGSGAASNLAVTVNPLPAQPSAITGPATLCEGNNAVFSVVNTAGITYTWNVPAGCTILSGQGTNSIEMTAGPTSSYIEVVPANSCGNGTGRSTLLTINPIPVQPATIEGPANPCEGSLTNYAVAPVGGVTFNWTVPTGSTITSGQGTYSILVTVGNTAGDITVTPTNDCGTGGSQVKSITISALPVQPGEITGTAEPCEGSSQVYSVDNLTGVNLQWGVPAGSVITAGQGTNSITVTIGPNSGNIELVAQNECGNSPVRNFYFTVQPLPSWTASISGPNQVIPNNTPSTNFSTTGATNATSYIWELTPPEAGTITGTGLTAEVTWSATFSGVAFIRARGINDCGEGGWSDTKEVLVIDNTGLQEPGQVSASVYPGPSAGQITTQLHSGPESIVARIFDITGKECYHTLVNGDGKTTMDHQFSAGYYIVVLYGNQATESYKVSIR